MDDPIAIVGMGCRYPDASTTGELFENSIAQRRSFRRIPDARLAADYFDESGASRDRAYSRQAAVINGFEFDRARFRVPLESYEVTDLTHWLALTVAAETIEDIQFRVGESHVHNDRVRVVVANTLTGEFTRASVMRLRWPYVRRVFAERLRKDQPDIDDAELVARLRDLERSYKRPFPVPNEDSLAGGLANTIAGRICNHFDFRGGGYSVDAACASSLLAVSDACSALVARDADMVLVGGVDLSLDPFELVGFSRSAALAPQEMLVYDEQSQGFWPGEGCGFVALMRYAEAVEQCETIHGVIKGWGISSDGRGGLTRPEAEGQKLALQRCYERAGFDISTVGYFEGHGTGTKVGDTAELGALISAREDARSTGAAAAVVSSIKANIGHTKAAAGLAALLRATKCLHEQVLPPTTACRKPHELLSQPGVNLTTSDRPRLWTTDGDSPRRAGVSAMGFGGINTHVTVEESPAAMRRSKSLIVDDVLTQMSAIQDAELFLFNAHSQLDLVWTIDRIAGFASELSLSELTDLSAELARRSLGLAHASFRAAVVASTPGELAERLQRLLQLVEIPANDELHIDNGAGVFFSSRKEPGSIGLIFPGQGAPARATGGAHARRFAEVANVYERAGFEEFDDRTDTDFAQPAIVTASSCGLKMLAKIGTCGDLAIGHSLGELTALHWAGCFSESDLVTMATARGRAIFQDPQTGGAMAAVGADSEVVAAAIAASRSVVIANINSPRQTVVSGDLAELDALIEGLRARGIAATLLRVRQAFHSPAMQGVVGAFGKTLDTLTFDVPQGRVVSTVTGRDLDAEVDLGAHLRDQVVAPVRFLDAVIHAAPDVDLFIEVGPGELMADLTRNCVSVPVVSLDVGSESMVPFLKAAAASFVLGRAPALTRLFADRYKRRFDWSWLPTFFENPCEIYAENADVDLGLETDIAEQPRDVEAVELDPSANSTDHVRALIAARTGLPPWTLEDNSRLSSDLHLNSITVSDIVIQAAIARGLLIPVNPSAYANATVGEIAAALDRLADLGEVASADFEGVARGFGRWIRDFEVVTVPARSLEPGPSLPQGHWDGFHAVESSGTDLIDQLCSRPFGDGVLVWLSESPGYRDLELLVAAAHRCLERARSYETVRFVVVQHGWGAAGFARSLFLEHPLITVVVVNVPSRAEDPTPDSEAIDHILAEIEGAPAGFSEVFVDAIGQRTMPCMQVVPGPVDYDMPIGGDDVVLVSGGGKGISAECGYALAKSTGCALLVLGRSQPDTDAELATNLQRLEEAEIRVSYHAADVTDPAAVRAAVVAGERILGGPVTGIVHGAGANYPRTVADLTVADIEATTAPKLGGLRNILGAVEPGRLKVLSAFSSIICRTGLHGEADYALANEWLGHEIEELQRRYPDCRCTAIEWSVWSGTGMGQRLGRVEALEHQGVAAISVDDGVDEFLRILSTPAPPDRLIVSGRFAGSSTVMFNQPTREPLRFTEKVLVDYPGVELVVESDVSSVSDLYLDDHMLEGDRVFPAVLALEAMCETAASLLGTDMTSSAVEFRDVAFRKAIVAPATDDAAISIRVVALAGPDGSVSLALRDSSTNFQINHVEAVCTLRERSLQPEGLVEAGPPAAGHGADPDPATALYESVLFQRGRFRRVASYDLIEARRCSSRLSSDGSTTWFGSGLPATSLLGDHGARDAALHAIQACIPHKTVIPMAVRKISASKLDPRASYRMFATEVVDRGDVLVYDMRIMDADNRVVERWDGLELAVVGQPSDLKLASPLLMAPVFERRVAAEAPQSELSVVLATANENDRTAKGRRDATHRPDGKPDPTDRNRHQSASYCQGWKLTSEAAVRVGCDLEAVQGRGLERWQHLIGKNGLELARVVSGLAEESVDVSATRVWTALEAMKKAGLPPSAPIVVDPKSRSYWVVLRSNDTTVFSSVIDASKQRPALCMAVALLGVV